jgi:hypothetical protein
VTAATALIAAIAGLVTAFSQFTGDSTPPPAAPATSAGTDTSAAVMDSDPQRWLRSHVPSSIRASCGPSEAPEEGAAASDECIYPEMKGIQYNLYASTGQMERTYERVKGDYQDARAWTGDSCGAGAYEGDYRDGDRAVGHRLCFLYYEKGRRKSAIVWTDNRVNILSFAWREDTNLAALVDAWDTGVGPD